MPLQAKREWRIEAKYRINKEQVMFLDDDLPKHKQPEPFPRKLVGKSVEEMREYRAELVEEIAKIDAESESRGKVKAAAEGLFG